MKNVLITGGAGGIGSEISKTFIENGYFVYIADTDTSAANKILELYGGEKCRVINLDVTDASSVDRYISSLGNDFSLNHIITLAGRAVEGEWDSFEKQSRETIERSVRLNLLGHIGIIHAFLPYLKKGRGDKSVLMISSINAVGDFGLPVYSAAKAGLIGFVNGIVGEFGREGIRINTVSPGTVVTEATKTEPKDYEKLLKTTAINRFVTADEVAKMAYAICNDFVSATGQNFVLDAGQSKIHGV